MAVGFGGFLRGRLYVLSSQVVESQRVPSNDIGGVATTSDCVNARVRADLIRVRCCILRKYGVAGLGYPMMVHLCDGASACRCEAEDVNANPSCEITGCGPKSCVYKWLAASGTETYGSAFSEKVSQDSTTDFLTIRPIAIRKQAWRHHEQSDPKFTHI